MAYKVIKAFTDGQDGMYVYNIGDDYPRKGANPTKERVKGLLGTNNKQGVPLIEMIEEEPEVVLEKPTPRKNRRKKG